MVYTKIFQRFKREDKTLIPRDIFFKRALYFVLRILLS